MGILLIILVLILACISLWLFFKIIKWAFRKRLRVIGLLIVLASIIIGIMINELFFVKMEFMQSKIYPDLYLIKKPVKNKDSLNKAIKEKVVQLTKNQKTKEMQAYNLRFYEYNKGDWGENGTAYFLDHEEKPEGMLPELLEYYPEYLLAKFSIQPCNENYFGKLDYYNGVTHIKIDTLLSSCKK